MRAHDIILKKQNGEPLTAEEIAFVVGGYTQGEVPDSEMAAWLKAVYSQGMTARETADLTMAMIRSGRTLDLSSIPGVKVDKHSTGGVGDKTTLVLVPLLAAAGVPVAKMSGRSLGHTGGTLDKLESIPGFSTALSPEQMVDQVKRIGAAIAGQSADLVPADKKIYALRDATSTVDCIPLIAASVMSKKIAAGADAIVLDVKVGSGAFMKTEAEAAELARAMVRIGQQAGKKVVAVITNMDQPLGRAVGNALEVLEAIETLKGGGPEDLVMLCSILGGMALILAGKVETLSDGENIMSELIADGRGASQLRDLIEAQGGDPAVVDDTTLLPTAPIVQAVKSSADGCIQRLDAMDIARAAGALGAGKGKVGTSLDLSVGIWLHKKIGDWVRLGDLLAEVHARDQQSADMACSQVLKACSFGPTCPELQGVVRDVVWPET